MERYCDCGYPIQVSGKWDGHDYHLVLRDGHASRAGQDNTPITRCPRCLRRLYAGDLDRLPPPLPLHPPEREQERAG